MVMMTVTMATAMGIMKMIMTPNGDNDMLKQ